LEEKIKAREGKAENKISGRYIVEVYDREGRLVERVEAGNTLTPNLAYALAGILTTKYWGVIPKLTTIYGKTIDFYGDLYETSTGGAQLYAWRFFMSDGEGIDVTGIVVGMGTPTENSLGRKIPHGTEAGQLYYGRMEFLGVDLSLRPTIFIRWRRTFENRSPSRIGITELGTEVIYFYNVGREDLTIAGIVLIAYSTIPITYIDPSYRASIVWELRLN